MNERIVATVKRVYGPDQDGHMTIVADVGYSHITMGRKWDSTVEWCMGLPQGVAAEVGDVLYLRAGSDVPYALQMEAEG